MKKIFKFLTVVCLLALIVTLAACGDKLENIYISKNPRTTYVQGQDLDLTGAEIKAFFGKSEETVDLSLVEVSGYNKDTLGEQTVTFSYEGQTATLKVNVIPRIEAEGVVTNYFVVYPVYVVLYGMPMEAIIGMYQAILPASDTLIKSLLIFNLPFTFIKGIIDAGVCFAVYKRISPILKYGLKK